MTTAVVVDANNVLHSANFQVGVGDPELRQRRLLDLLASYAAEAGVRIVAIYDGAGPFSSAGDRTVTAELEVRATGSEPADPTIERCAKQLHEDGLEVWLVTSDAAVRDTVGAAAARTISADAFAAALLAEAAETDAANTSDPTGSSGGSRLDSTIPEALRARLEQMRRGEG